MVRVAEKVLAGIDRLDPTYYTAADGDGHEKRHAKQASMWVATHDLPRTAAGPFYTCLNQILDQAHFDGFVETRCQPFYADDGRPGLPPGRYFRMLLLGHFEGLDTERAIAWRAADSLIWRLTGVRTPRTLEGRALAAVWALWHLLVTFPAWQRLNQIGRRRDQRNLRQTARQRQPRGTCCLFLPGGSY